MRNKIKKKKNMVSDPISKVPQNNFKNYSEAGASLTKKGFIGISNILNTPDDDITLNKDILMARSRQLYMGNAVAVSAIKKLKTNVIGTGLKLKSVINNELLGISEEEADKLEKRLETLWEYWAESTECDYERFSNFYQLQSLAMQTQLIDGECFTTLPYKLNPNEIFSLKIRFIDSMRCKSPNGTDTDNIVGGVEIDRTGVPVAYHFTKSYKDETTVRVPIFGSQTGRKNILVLMDKERIGQRRGVPLLAPVIEELHQITKITKAELINIAVSSIFTAFITNAEKTTVGTGISGLEDEDEPGTNRVVKLESGNFAELNPGQDIKFAEPKRQTASLDICIVTVSKLIGAALGIPHEVLLNSFNASYSASRAALNEVWKTYNQIREWHITDFCKPIYEEFVDSIVAQGLIELPGYSENLLKRKAYLGSEWFGISAGQLDPVKEVKASILKIDNGLSTKAREAKILGGHDLSKINKQRKKEIADDLLIEEMRRKSRKE